MIFQEDLNQRLFNIRHEFANEEFDESKASKNPFEEFGYWMDEALKAEVSEPNAVTLATCSSDGKPTARVVLLRGFDEKGFVFFTNYNSRKGDEIDANPNVCLNFFWTEIGRQVRIQGVASKIPSADSEEYFNSRPRESQIGAWASYQSEELESAQELKEKVAEIEKRYEGRDVPRPEHWGGYCVSPDYIEFWQGRMSRLHDRLVYSRDDSGIWTLGRLSP